MLEDIPGIVDDVELEATYGGNLHEVIYFKPSIISRQELVDRIMEVCWTAETMDGTPQSVLGMTVKADNTVSTYNDWIFYQIDVPGGTNATFTVPSPWVFGDGESTWNLSPGTNIVPLQAKSSSDYEATFRVGDEEVKVDMDVYLLHHSVYYE